VTYTSQQSLSRWICLSAFDIKHFEVWRFGSYMFAHANVLHILMNMWGLYIFGKPLEARLGPTRFLNLYLASGFVGGLFWMLFNWNSEASVIGASGAVCGVMVAVAMVYPTARVAVLLPLLIIGAVSLFVTVSDSVMWIAVILCLLFMDKIPAMAMTMKSLVWLFIAMDVVGEWQLSRAAGAQVAHLAHLAGMLGGFLYMRLAFRQGGSGFDGVRDWWARLRLRRARRNEHGAFDHLPPRGGPPQDDGLPDNFRVEVDRILDKIGAQGISSLTPAERQTLEQARQRFKRP